MNVCLPLNPSHIVKVPTRYSATTQKCIQPILTSYNYFTTVRATHVDFTDHAFVSAEIDLPITGPATATLLRPKRKLFAHSCNSLLQALDGQNFEEIRNDYVDIMWEEWHRKFSSALDTVAPKTAVE